MEGSSDLEGISCSKVLYEVDKEGFGRGLQMLDEFEELFFRCSQLLTPKDSYDFSLDEQGQ